MSYTVFARKYRPQTFADLVGQSHIARTLAQAIEQDRVAHAFLFTGVRGVGKTSTARILAKALNCTTGPTTEPCNTCERCIAITAGNDLDVQEIDGASNNGVDDVRRMQETLPFRPSQGPYKMIIIDEVHMLSTGAFNALLKTLEEPPPHVKFVFATTESHKVPITIRSRCQRFDFRLISSAAIVSQLKSVLEQEGVRSDEATLAAVSREAAGSMRDALTLVDQLVTSCGDTLEASATLSVLGTVAREALFDLIEPLVKHAPADFFSALQTFSDSGTNPLQLLRQLCEMLRDTVVFALTRSSGATVEGAEADLHDTVIFSDRERKRAQALLEEVPLAELQRLFAAATRLVDDVGRSMQSALVLEMGLLRYASQPELGDLQTLIARVKNGASTDSASHASPRSPAAKSADPKSVDLRSVSKPAAERSQEPAPRLAFHSAVPTAVTTDVRAFQEVAKSEKHRASPRDKKTSDVSRDDSSASADPDRAASMNADEARDTSKAIVGGSGRDVAATGAEVASVAVPSSSAPMAEVNTSTTDGVRLRHSAFDAWSKIVSALRDERPALAAVLEHAIPRVMREDAMVISFKEDSFYARQADSPKAKQAIHEVARKLFGWDAKLKVEKVPESGDLADMSVAAVAHRKRSSERERIKKSALDHPIVLDAMAVFPSATPEVKIDE